MGRGLPINADGQRLGHLHFVGGRERNASDLGELPLAALEDPDEVNQFKTDSEYAEDVEMATMHVSSDHPTDARPREHSADATLLERDPRRTQERTGGELKKRRPLRLAAGS